MLDHCSIFSSLHEPYFASKTCIHFAQLDFLLFQQVKAGLAKEAIEGAPVPKVGGESALHSIIKKSSVMQIFSMKI